MSTITKTKVKVKKGVGLFGKDKKVKPTLKIYVTKVIKKCVTAQ